MKAIFIIAMESEADAVLRHMTDVLRFEECGRVVCRGTLRGEAAAVVICGVGKVNAAAGTQYAIDRFAPERVVNLGVAGGLDASMEVGGVYRVSKCFQCDFDLSEINGTARGVLNEYETPYFELEVADCDLPTAIVSTGDSFSNVDADRAFVHDEMGASLRDMELAAIAHVCRRAGVKCVALKAVSDLHFPNRPQPTEQFSANLPRVVDALAEVVWRMTGKTEKI